MGESSIRQSGESEWSASSASLPMDEGFDSSPDPSPDSSPGSSTDAIISKNLDGIVLGWNRAAQRLLGYRADEIVGRDGAMIIPMDRREEETRVLARLRAGELVERYKTRRRHKDGSEVSVVVTISVMHDPDGRVVAASKIMRRIPDCDLAPDSTKCSDDLSNGKIPAGTETESDEEAIMPHTLTQPAHQNRLSDLHGNRDQRSAFNTAVRVLLVEDHLDTLQATRRLLGALGYHVITARSGVEALEQSAKEPFDVIVSDIGLPDVTGNELMRQVRERYPRKPGIALTGYAMADDVQASADAGFAVHLTKPIDLNQLHAAIGRLVTNRG
jgi:PAS domain S-box-containing protein